MGRFNSFFEHNNCIHSHSFEGGTLASETTIARRFDGSPNFGRLLYSRSVGQVLMQAGSRYELRIAPRSFEFQYRNINEDLFAPYDYFRATGDGDKTNLLIQQSVPVPGLNIQAKVTLAMELTGTNTHKFNDLCKEHFFEVSLSDGKAQLFGYRGLNETSPSISIPLRLLAEPNNDAPIENADAPQVESAPAPVG